MTLLMYVSRLLGGKHCWDMFGWVVPNGLTPDFKQSWMADDDAALEKYMPTFAIAGRIAMVFRTQLLMAIFLKRRTDNVLPAYAEMIPGAMFRLSSCYDFN